MQIDEDPEAKIATFGEPADLPERGLMVAMIEQAKNDFYGANDGRFVKDALTWLTAKDPDPVKEGRGWLYSFESICEQLDLDAETIRKGILNRYKGDIQD